MNGGPVFDYEDGVVGIVTKIEPERFISIGNEANNVVVPSPEHLTVALQSGYIHTGIGREGIYI